jgi:GT2 family glycosyltransferase
MLKVGVVIPTYKRALELDQCIKSLKKNTLNNFTIVVVNDCSDEEVSRVLHVNHPECIEITSTTDLWWTKSINVGLRYLVDNKFDAAILLNDDVTVESGFIDSMMAFFLEHQDNILISKIVDQDNRVWSIGGDVSWPFYGERHISPECQENSISWSPGMGTLIPLKVVNQIGYLDEKAMPQYLSDTDFGLRATRNGWVILLNKSSVVRNNTLSTGGILGEKKLTFKDFRFILFNLRSPDYIKARFIFIFRHAPVGLKTISFITRQLKLVIYFVKRCR